MIGVIKRHIYWALAVAVLIVAVVAVGAYAWNFRALPVSTNTGKWADFATYLSGTVGVAAVVATLMAFVITLRQQKRLIDSQDEMLEKQKEQLGVANEQLKNEKRSREVEFAYQASMQVFPHLMNSVSNGFLEGVRYYDRKSRSFSQVIAPNGLNYNFVDLQGGSRFFDCNFVNSLYRNMNKMHSFKQAKFLYCDFYDYGVMGFYSYKANRELFLNSTRKWLSLKCVSSEICFEDVVFSINDVFKEVNKASIFAAKNIKISEDLKGYYISFFEDVSKFSIDDPVDKNRKINFKFILLCYHAFLLGFQCDDNFNSRVKDLGFPDNIESLLEEKFLNAPVMSSELLEAWFEIGSFLKDKKSIYYQG